MAKQREFTKEEVSDICNSYKNGASRNSLCKKYHCSDRTITKVLNKNNIEIIRGNFGINHNSRYKINEEYFDLDNQTENSAYILGILASDGCVSSKENQVYIELQRCDKELLEKINKELKNERPVKDYHNNSKNYDNSKLYFFSKRIKEKLALYNIIPKKTYYSNNDFMQNVKEEYYIDFIRGLFDGDGSIKWVNGTIEWQIDSSSYATVNHIQKILKENYNILSKVSKREININRKIPLYRVYFYGKENSKKIYQLFYQNNYNGIYLERKKKTFEELFLKYKTHETSHPKEG